MSIHFGNLERVRHMITYSLSLFELKAFLNYFSKGIPNMWRRVSSQFFMVVLPSVVAYMIYIWGNAKFEHLLRNCQLRKR